MSDRFVKTLVCYLLVGLAYYDRIDGQVIDTYGPPRVEKNPIYLDSFVPASMQVIAHVTDLMKYEPVPFQRPTTPATPSTSSHRPGVYAPVTPPNRVQQLTTKNPWWKLGELRYPDIGGYFNRYRYGWSLSTVPLATDKPALRKVNDRTTADENLDLLDVITRNLYKKVNALDDYGDDSDIYNQVEKFTQDYDDDASTFLRKKRPPPTRAYVTLLSLYDGLNKEAKKLSLNKYSGYTKRILQDLAATSKGTSASQLRTIFSKILERRDITLPQIVNKIKTLVDDLDQPKSYINDALKDIPPLEFDANF